MQKINSYLKDSIVKIVVDGMGAVGKTTMLKKFEYGTFDPKTKITIGIDFFTKEYNHLFDRNVRAQFWDIVGAERFKFLRPTAYKGANCILLVIDLTRLNTLDKIEYFMNIAKEANVRPEQIILVGNKTDLFYLHTINRGYLSSVVEDHGFCGFIETSARNNHNLEVLFEFATGTALYNKGLISEDHFETFKGDIKKRIKEPNIKPHVKKIRKCWKCGNNLYFYEFCDSNTNTSEERLLELWKSPYLQFFCCNCYKNIIMS